MQTTDNLRIKYTLLHERVEEYWKTVREIEADNGNCPDCGYKLTYAPTFGDYYCRRCGYRCDGMLTYGANSFVYQMGDDLS